MIKSKNRIGFVTGLIAEARWLAGSGFMVRVGGGTPAGARQAAQGLVEAGAQALVSFGLAGGLEPGLKPGSIVVPKAVLIGPESYFCDSLLSTFLGGMTHETILAGEKIAATVQDKRLIFQAGRPVAVDLESGAVAEVSTQNNLPFAVLRAVADPAERDLPPAALAALRDDGSLDLLKIARSIAGRPWQIPGLIMVGWDTKRARQALRERLKSLPASL